MVLTLSLLPRQAFAQSAEEEAVKAVLIAETEAYFSRDAEAWQAAWMQNDKSIRTYVSAATYSLDKGWENIGPKMIEWIRNNPTPSDGTFRTDNFLIRVDETMAVASYDQWQEYTDAGQKKEWHSREQRMLVNDNGRWKIAAMTTIAAQSIGSSPVAIEYSLNANGYHLLEANRVKEAIEVFKMNVALFPDAWNTYDSLGEAYARDGNKKLAIKNYEKSIALNPDNKVGIAALNKLKGKMQADAQPID
jgi:tetratricopeptide (TPR) repeat protein